MIDTGTATYKDMKRMAEDRARWRSSTTNLQIDNKRRRISNSTAQLKYANT